MSLLYDTTRCDDVQASGVFSVRSGLLVAFLEASGHAIRPFGIGILALGVIWYREYI